MLRSSCALSGVLLTLGLVLGGCGDGDTGAGGASSGTAATTSPNGAGPNGSGPNGSGPNGASGSGSAANGSTGSGAGGSSGSGYLAFPADGPAAGNPAGACDVPSEAALEDTSAPDHVIGDGSPASCTSAAVVEAVAQGGVITFSCGPDPITITLDETAKIFNDTGPKIVIDGGAKVTLSGADARRILYQNTCDEAQHYTTDHCQDQDSPSLTLQNLTFEHGNASGDDPDGGGAVFVRGGRVKIVNSRFFSNACDDVGPDVGGAAVRTLSQSGGQPVYVVHSTFGGDDTHGAACSNGGGLSSIGVSYTVINSLFSYNEAIGNGANPASPGTPGGGSGGAIYNDGNTFTLDLCGVDIEHNHANEGGGAIFFVSNDLTGTLHITDSTLSDNPSDGFETNGYPGIFYLGMGDPVVVNSTLQ